jgi:hypothetical protein
MTYLTFYVRRLSSFKIFIILQYGCEKIRRCDLPAAKSEVVLGLFPKLRYDGPCLLSAFSSLPKPCNNDLCLRKDPSPSSSIPKLEPSSRCFQKPRAGLNVCFLPFLLFQNATRNNLCWREPCSPKPLESNQILIYTSKCFQNPLEWITCLPSPFFQNDYNIDSCWRESSPPNSSLPKPQSVRLCF